MLLLATAQVAPDKRAALYIKVFSRISSAVRPRVTLRSFYNIPNKRIDRYCWYQFLRRIQTRFRDKKCVPDHTSQSLLSAEIPSKSVGPFRRSVGHFNFMCMHIILCTSMDFEQKNYRPSPNRYHNLCIRPWNDYHVNLWLLEFTMIHLE